MTLIPLVILHLCLSSNQNKTKNYLACTLITGRIDIMTQLEDNNQLETITKMCHMFVFKNYLTGTPFNGATSTWLLNFNCNDYYSEHKMINFIVSVTETIIMSKTKKTVLIHV